MNDIEGILAERNKKYHMTVGVGGTGTSASKKMARVSTRNSSFGLKNLKNRVSVNMDTCSMNSYGSSQQNESVFNHRTYVLEDKSKEFG